MEFWNWKNLGIWTVATEEIISNRIQDMAERIWGSGGMIEEMDTSVKR